MSSSNKDFEMKTISVISSRREFENLNRETQRFGVKVEMVDATCDLESAINELKKNNELAVDCEGVNIGRSGKLTLLQMGPKNSAVYLFDILKLGSSAFDYGLKEILESQSIRKYAFDCRFDSDSLWHEYGVRLSNLYDMQLLEYLCRPKAGTHFPPPRNLGSYKRPVIRGMNATVQKYVNSSQLSSLGCSNYSQIKQREKDLIRFDETLWRYRPLSEGLMKYAASDIVMIWAMAEALERYVPLNGLVKDQVSLASERYAGVRRDHERVEEFYTRTPILQSEIIPKICGGRLKELSSAGKSCVGCKREMPNVDSQSNLCEDCKEIKRVSRHRR